MFQGIKQAVLKWLSNESAPSEYPLCDFERIRYEVRPCDVLLIEGRSRVSEVIKNVTYSPWSHAGLYIGRLHDIDNLQLRNQLSEHVERFKGEPNDQLIIEGYMGKGTIVSPLSTYEKDHIRICRPRGLSRSDAQRIIAFAIARLGNHYDIRQALDLMRYLFPWMILPRKWRSSIFEYTSGEMTKAICSSIVAEAFTSVNFPILPLIKQHEETGIELIRRNPRLFTPKDFDYSPYFDIVKYPFVQFADHAAYHDLPWDKKGLISNDAEGLFDPTQKKPEQFEQPEKPPKKKKSLLHKMKEFRDDLSSASQSTTKASTKKSKTPEK